MPENQNTENRRQRATRRAGNAIRGGSRTVADLATLGGHVRRYNIDRNFVEFDKIPDARKRYVTRIMMNADLRSIGPEFASGAKHLREVRFTPDPDRDRLNRDDPIGEKEVSLIAVIPTNAFSGCDNLNVVDWEALANLARIESGAFSNTAIREVAELPNLTYIGEGAFNECSKLRHVYLSDDVKYIGANAFAGCTRLVNNDKAIFGGRGVFELPKNLEYLGEGAFAGCKRIKKVKFPESIREVSGNPFINDSCYKENGKLKLTARWRNWRTQIEIPGIERHPIRAKELQKIETNLDGLRHIQLKDEHYIETEPGKFTQVTTENYEKWLEARNEAYQSFQVTPEAFRDYCMSTWGKEIDLANIPQWKLDAWLNGVALEDEINITFGVGDSVSISPKKLKDAIMAMQKAKADAVKEDVPREPTEESKKAFELSKQQLIDECFYKDLPVPFIATMKNYFNIDISNQAEVDAFIASNKGKELLEGFVKQDEQVAENEAEAKTSSVTVETPEQFGENEVIIPAEVITPVADDATQDVPRLPPASELYKFILENNLSQEYLQQKASEGVDVNDLSDLQAAVRADVARAAMEQQQQQAIVHAGADSVAAAKSEEEQVLEQSASR